MDKRIKVFIVGAGVIAYHHARNIPADKAELAGIVEIDPSQAQAFMKVYPSIEYYENIDLFLKRSKGENDLAVVATPPPVHYEICMKLLEHGYNVLGEKPLAVNHSDALRISELAAKKGVVAGGCESRLTAFRPVQLAAQHIREGKLGNIYLIEQKAINRLFRIGIEYQPQSKWFLNKKLSGGGPVIDWGSYDIAVLQAITGGLDKCSVKYAKLVNKLAPVEKRLEELYDVEEHAFIVSEMTDITGNTFTFVHDRSTVNYGPEPWYMRILGDKGGIEMKWMIDEPFFKFYSYDLSGPVTISHEIDPNYEFLGYPIKNIIDCILDGSTPAITFKQAAFHLDYVTQAYSISGFYDDDK